MGVLVLFFSSCAIEIALHHSRVRNIPMCESKISVTECGQISYTIFTNKIFPHILTYISGYISPNLKKLVTKLKLFKFPSKL